MAARAAGAPFACELPGQAVKQLAAAVVPAGCTLPGILALQIVVLILGSTLGAALSLSAGCECDSSGSAAGRGLKGCAPGLNLNPMAKSGAYMTVTWTTHQVQCSVDGCNPSSTERAAAVSNSGAGRGCPMYRCWSNALRSPTPFVQSVTSFAVNGPLASCPAQHRS